MVGNISGGGRNARVSRKDSLLIDRGGGLSSSCTIGIVFISLCKAVMVGNISGGGRNARVSRLDDGLSTMVECVGVDEFGFLNHFSLYNSISIDFLRGLMMGSYVLLR